VFGRSTHQLDPKGRVFIPKRLQGQLPADAAGVRGGMLIRGLDGCLALMGQEAFEALVKRLRTGPFQGTRGRRFERLFFSFAFPVQLDKNGRLQLPKEMRAVGGLEDETEVELVGLDDRIEIWSAARWAEQVDAFSGEYDLLAPIDEDPVPNVAAAAADGGEVSPPAPDGGEA
jgi:MraZ protein